MYYNQFRPYVISRIEKEQYLKRDIMDEITKPCINLTLKSIILSLAS